MDRLPVWLRAETSENCLFEILKITKSWRFCNLIKLCKSKAYTGDKKLLLVYLHDLKHIFIFI